MAEELVLDRDVRLWVLFPLTVSVMLMQLLRQYATALLGPSKPAQPPKASELREKNAVTRSQYLRATGGFIPDGGFIQRRAYFLAKDTGVFQAKVEKKDMQEMMLSSPDMMQGMVKQQLGGLVPQIGMGALVNFFFSGFILGKVPFSLSPRFRIMLQRGIDLPGLDPSYFTSLSYYILLLFGLRGVFTLIFREDAINDAAQMMAMQQQMQAMGGGNPMAWDTQKAFDGEKSALGLLDHRWKLKDSEERAAALLRTKLGYGSTQRKGGKRG